MFKSVIKNKWATAFGVVFISFLMVNVFLFPLYNSGDDVFLMYTLAGGYGEAPTNLLHYNHIWHPILGWVVKTFFETFPTINWFTIFLMLFQLFGCATILYVLSHRFQWLTALGFFLVFFFFFEVRILLSLNFSSTSWVLTTAGFVLLLHNIKINCKAVNLFFPCFLLLLGGLLRIQILFAITILFLPAFFMYARKEYKKWVTVIVSILFLIFLLNLQHKCYYNKYIAGWKKQEQIRQSLFYFFNSPKIPEKQWEKIFRDSTEKTFYFTQFFYDTSYVSAQRVEQIGKSLVRKRNFKIAEDYQVLYWFFIGIRIYILLFIICFFLLWQQGILSKVFRRWIVHAALIGAVFCYLFLFLKFTEAVFVGLLMLLWIYLWLAIPVDKIAFAFVTRRFSFAALLLVLPFSWMSISIFKKDRINRQKHQLFKCVIPEISNNPDKLFIATDDAVPMDYFYIWDVPAKYPLPNLIYKDRVLTHTYSATLQRFEIADVMQSIYQKENVFLLGKESPALKNYYWRQDKINIEVSSKLNGFKCLEVRKASINSTNPHVDSSSLVK